MIFIPLSFYYLYIVYSLTHGRGVLDSAQFLDFILNQKALLFLGLVVVWSIFSMKRFVKGMFLIFTFIIFLQSFYTFYQTENKIVLFATFFYLLVSFFFYLFLTEELDSSIFNPNFKKNQLYKKDKYNFNVTIKNKKGICFDAILTNWDEDSCFVCVKQAASPKDLNGLVCITVNFLEKKFSAMGRIMTSYVDGYGIRFVRKGEKKGSTLGWKDFYAIMVDRAILVREKRGLL